MAESQRRTRSRKAQAEVQAEPEPAVDAADPTFAQVSDANTVDPPTAEIDVFEGSQAPAPKDVVGVHSGIDVGYISGVENGAVGSTVEKSPGAVAGLFQRREFVEQLVAAIFTDSAAADSLLGGLSDKLQDQIEDDPEFKHKLLTSAMANPRFRGKVVKALAKAMR